MSDRAILCPYCGAPNKPGATVCEYCEKALDSAGASAKHSQPEIFAEATIKEVETHSAGSGSYRSQSSTGSTSGAAPAEKNKVVAGLLAIFLGSLGIHKFYLGYKREGLIMLGASIIGSILLFSIIPSLVNLVSFIEGIIYLTKSNTEFYETYVAGRKEWF